MLAFALLLLTVATVDDERGPDGLRLGVGAGAGVVAGDTVAGVDVLGGVGTAPFSFFVRVPLVLRLQDAPPTVDPTAPAFCRLLRCEELLAGDALDPTALARIVDEVRLFAPGDVVSARAGRLLVTLGSGAVLDRFTTAPSWDRRTSGARLAVRAPWHALAVDVVVADVLSPGSLVAGRVEAAVVDDRASFFAPLRLGIETGVDATAPVDGVDRAGAVVDAGATRPLTSTALVSRWLWGDERLFVAPRLEAGVVTGLSADGGDDGSVGAGAGVGGDVGVAFGGVDVRLRGTASWGTAAWRRAPFSTLYLVERRRALLGATTAAGAGAPGGLLRVPAPGGYGVDVRVEASLFDVVAPLLRVHTGPAPGENVVEAGVIVDADPLRVAVTALRRGMGAVSDVVAPDLVAFPVVGTLEASWRVWGPFSVGVRWLRLPRFRGDGPLRIDDDVWGLLAADGVLAWP